MPQQHKLLVPTLCTLAGILILCGLGWWQLQRLEWKQGLITALDKEYAKDASKEIIEPSALERIEGRNYDDSWDEEHHPPPPFSRGTLRGHYDFDNQIAVAPRVYGNIPGKHVYTPFILEDGSVILINRGWVPNEWTSETETPQARAAAQSGSVTGLIRAPDHNPFMPDNDLARNQWYYADPEQFAQLKGIKNMHTKVLYLEGAETEGNYPVAAATKPVLPNDHLQYAIFWFTMAGLLFVIYVLRFLKKDNSHG